ncbi:hypothetical protein [Aggregatibacter actinomycetemcomitans]|uniref:hypothetical protein n=2 Tax=Aggregatibacter actinomycetemcomitans TaxID=714 RepID=UPI0011DDB42E|nr:hypothetical protein [Aggregatibacter actinomycetemcomitans]QEH49186.1 hypothetical protein FXN57_05630 [Aggregatibacter actinomycetemcomitans]
MTYLIPTNFIAKEFYKGAMSKSILMQQAYKDLNECSDIDAITDILGFEAYVLLARIKRYADARNLRFDREINDEIRPFYAVKSQLPPNGESWESFKARKGDMRKELVQLRAYFWDEKTDNEELMCITHFIHKTTQCMTTQDQAICRNQKHFFE